MIGNGERRLDDKVRARLPHGLETSDEQPHPASGAGAGRNRREGDDDLGSSPAALLDAMPVQGAGVRVADHAAAPGFPDADGAG